MSEQPTETSHEPTSRQTSPESQTDGPADMKAGVKPGDAYKVWITERPGKETGVWSEAVGVIVGDRPVRADDVFTRLPQSLSGTVTDVDTGKPVAGAEVLKMLGST